MHVADLLLGLDPLSRLFAAAFLLAAAPCLIYMRGLGQAARPAAGSLAFIGAALGVVTAANFLAFLAFWELMVLAACYLIVHDRKPASFPVMYRYFLIQMVAGASLFLAVALQYATTSSFAMDAVAPEAVPFFLLAFLVKAAVVPFHIWVPLTYPCVAPAVAVVLSAYTTKIGVYAFMRFLPGMPALAYAGALTALFGAAMALRQPTARRLLSYQHVAQVGYMMTGIGLGTELAAGGAAVHALSHVAYMGLLFMVAGAVVHRTGTDALAGRSGVAIAMPLTFATALIGAAALAGMPPLSGYVGKTVLKAAAEGHPALQAALLLAGVGTAMAMVGLLGGLFLGRPPAGATPPARPREMPPAACLAMGVLAFGCLAQGALYPRLFPATFDALRYPVFALAAMAPGALPVLVGAALYGLFRGAAEWVPGRAPARMAASLAPLTAAPAARPVAKKLWDIHLLYGWLFDRLLRASRNAAARATDETQLYILLITALLVALVALLWW